MQFYRPVCVLTGWPANPATSSPSISSFTASKATATFECSLDDQSYFACTSPASFGALADGSHTFSVRAKDGIVYDAIPASYTWTVNVAIGRLNLNPFTSIASAYAASSDGNQLELRAANLVGDLNFNRPVAFTLKGGMDAVFLNKVGTSNTYGTVTISDGTIIMDGIAIN